MMNPTIVVFLSFGIAVAGLILTRTKRYWDDRVKLAAIPTYGNEGFFSSYISAWEFVKHATSIVQNGYRKYPNQAFKIPMIDRWLVVVTGRDMIEDLRKAGDEELSLMKAFQVVLRTKEVFGSAIVDVPFHLDVIKGALTKRQGPMFGDLYDEVCRAFEDEIPLTEEWVKVPTLLKALNIICRTSNRAFVGSPLCRNEEWKALNIRFSVDVMKAAGKINLFPTFLQPLVGWYINPLNASMKVAMKHLEPVINERLEKFKAGDVDSLEEDMLTWFIQVAPRDGSDPDRWLKPRDLAARLLSVNFGAIHTTSQAFTHALINLASHPEYIEPLRKEIEYNIETDGWTKTAMGKMYMLDSFLKESQRVSSSGALSVRRYALQEFVFSNGTVIPAGTLIATSASALHFDENSYSNPLQFDGLRSYRKRDQEEDSVKYQMVTPDADYLSFGAGKHACPGRFFAVNELKAIFSHVLMHYDIKLDDADKPAKTEEFGGWIQSNSKTQVMFRKRRV